MCLPIIVFHPHVLLAKGEHLGFEWVVTHNDMGYRCGYVRVPPGHPWHGKDYDHEAVDASVHGGLTFASADEHCEKGGPDDAWWFGFDCAHCDDAPDPTLPGAARMKFAALRDGTIRTQPYVEAECRRLCEQANQATVEKGAA